MKGIILHDHEVRQLSATGTVLVVRPMKPQPVKSFHGEWIWPQGSQVKTNDAKLDPPYGWGKAVWGILCGPFHVKDQFFVKEAHWYNGINWYYRSTEPKGFLFPEKQSWWPASWLQENNRQFTVEVEAVYFKQVRDITPEECRQAGEPRKNNDIGVRYGFGQQWNRLNLKHQWDSNPWCWFATLKRV